MSPIQIDCPSCGAAYRVKAENIGKKARCARCSHVFVVHPPEHGPTSDETEDSLLVPCPYCGFQDFGNFCSECGGRLEEVTALDFEPCKIPANGISQLLSTHAEETTSRSADDVEEERYQLRGACEDYNDHVSGLARAWRYKRGAERRYAFDRATIGEFADGIPEGIANRQRIVDRLWTLVGFAEREIAQEEISEALQSAMDAIEAKDVKRATRSMTKLRDVVESSPRVDATAELAQAEDRLRELENELATEKRRVEFDKLLTKADKLAFQQDFKKAVKAYQGCLFWLSRNELPDKAMLQSDSQQKLEQAQAALAG